MGVFFHSLLTTPYICNHALVTKLRDVVTHTKHRKIDTIPVLSVSVCANVI